jgi:monofunctional biosynthetic peptidoglycan transglycosylase
MESGVNDEHDSNALAGFPPARDPGVRPPLGTGLTLGRVLRTAVRGILGLALAWVGAVVLLGLAYTIVPPVSSLMLGRWLTGRNVERTYVPLEGMSPLLPAAVIASEDARFCSHGGVDWEALWDVVEEADEDGPSRGASTIPMQVAKNLFLWPSRSYLRKGLEIPLALYIDLLWSKRRMIEVYLNVAEWGDGVFGAEAAAQRHFRKSARDLSRREAALLAKALPSPLRRNPARPSPGHRRLAERLMPQFDASGALTACLRSSDGGQQKG